MPVYLLLPVLLQAGGGGKGRGFFDDHNAYTCAGEGRIRDLKSDL